MGLPWMSFVAVWVWERGVCPGECVASQPPTILYHLQWGHHFAVPAKAESLWALSVRRALARQCDAAAMHVTAYLHHVLVALAISAGQGEGQGSNAPCWCLFKIGWGTHTRTLNCVFEDCVTPQMHPLADEWMHSAGNNHYYELPCTDKLWIDVHITCTYKVMSHTRSGCTLVVNISKCM